jgi:methionyl-tRNA synthetase
MVEKYCGGVVPRSGTETALDTSDRGDFAAYHSALDGPAGYLLHEGLKAIWGSVGRGNEFVDRQAPWKLAKDPALRVELESTLASLCRHLARQCVALFPYMPDKVTELWRALGGPGEVSHQRFEGIFDLDVTGWRVSKGAPLFPKES